MTATKTDIFRCSLEDLDLFSAASHDRTPLHSSNSYARATPYGERIFFGVFGALICLGRLCARPGYILTRAVLEFRHAIFVDIDYVIEAVDHDPEHATVKISDGPQVVSVITATFQPIQSGATCTTDNIRLDTDTSIRTEPANLQGCDLLPGLHVQGLYAPLWQILLSIMEQVELMGKGIHPMQVAALMWGSYLVGMELPGRRGLCYKLTFDFSPQWHDTLTAFTYLAQVVRFDPRFDLLTTRAELHTGNTLLAKATIQAFVRQEAPFPSSPTLESLLPRSQHLTGRVALVIGGSRGLGAAIVQALALQGCTVLVNFLQSKDSAEHLQKNLIDAPGRLELVQGDASSLMWCEQLYMYIVAHHGRLDYLICNACPPLQPLHLHARTANRINEYVNKSVALVSTPMATFLSLLSQNTGWLITISAQMTQSPSLAEWSHFVCAKGAIEGLTRSMAVSYDAMHFLIVRPPKMRTELTNTPIGRQGAIAPELVAARVIQHLCRSLSVEHVDIIENFS